MHHTLIVANQHITLDVPSLTVLSFEQYLADYPKWNEPKTRVINLCDTDQYLSNGYYCSLLAEARQHRVIPSVNTINDLRLVKAGQEGQSLVIKPQEKAIIESLGGEFFVCFGNKNCERTRTL